MEYQQIEEQSVRDVLRLSVHGLPMEEIMERTTMGQRLVMQVLKELTLNGELGKSGDRYYLLER